MCVCVTLLVVIIICITFVKLRNCCKAQCVCVHPRIALYKSYLLLLLELSLLLLQCDAIVAYGLKPYDSLIQLSLQTCTEKAADVHRRIVQQQQQTTVPREKG